MKPEDFDMGDIDIAWCPGCGDFGILDIVKKAAAELELKPQELVLVSGIGQAAKLPHYMKCNLFNGLHGRPIPPATAIKASNPGLTVIVTSGDGDLYGEGGNHFLHAIRRNPDITVIAHNNMVYGLTKGQASPTSRLGFETPVQVDGVFMEPFNPLAIAIASNAPFVARAFCKHIKQATEIIKQAIGHKGFSLVDVFQPCPTFNNLNTYDWFEENTYYMEDHDPSDRTGAMKKAMETEKLPLGVFYKTERPTFVENLAAYAKDKKPLHKRKVRRKAIKLLIESKRE